MIKPERLHPGDTVAIVSLSSGTLGEKWALHKLKIARERLENDFQLKVKVMPNALKGIDFVYNHPEARARDLMDAFADKNIKAIICAIGGEDTIRILPYINFDTIKNNPKIFLGYSDCTVNHFMMHKAGLVSFYGPTILTDFSAYVEIPPYTVNALKNTLFEPKKNFEIESSKVYSLEADKVWWKEENINVKRKFHREKVGYEVLQGKGKVQGELFGGCIDTFVFMQGTSIWPKLSDWRGKILCLETSEEKPTPKQLTHILRNLHSQGILNVINGIIVGKPVDKKYYESYKEVYKKVISTEAGLKDLPIIYNVNFGHALPITVLPFGVKAELDCDNKKITLLETATK